MDPTILATIISSSCTLIGVLITVILTTRKQRLLYEEKQKQQQSEINDIRSTVNQQNQMFSMIPVINTKLEYIEKMVDEIRKRDVK